MQKFAITVGTVKGKLTVLEGPSGDVDGQVKALEELTLANGVKKIGKSQVQVDDAIIMHSTKAVLKRRSFKPVQISKGAPPETE